MDELWQVSSTSLVSTTQLYVFLLNSPYRAIWRKRTQESLISNALHPESPPQSLLWAKFPPHPELSCLPLRDGSWWEEGSKGEEKLPVLTSILCHSPSQPFSLPMMDPREYRLVLSLPCPCFWWQSFFTCLPWSLWWFQGDWGQSISIFFIAHSRHSQRGLWLQKSCGSLRCRAFIIESGIQHSIGNREIGMCQGPKWGVPKCCPSI